MQQITNIADGIYQLSINVENILFESIWEIPNGVTLNSYIIKGEKTAIVDGVCGWDGVPESLYALIEKMNIKPEEIEYLIVNHTEPDHSGWMVTFKEINPNCKIVCSKRARDLLEEFYGISENVMVVGNNDTLDLGKGHVLNFVEIPNVHWPDTIATLDTLTGTLFSCDAFGSFGKITNSRYADELTEEELAFFDKEAVRYFSNVLGYFSPQVKKAVEKCQNLPIKTVAPGHGLVYRNPEQILKVYSQYADYQKGPARKEITLLWSSMYGMTEKAVNHVIEVLKKEDIKVNIHQIPQTDWGTVLTSAWTSTGIILAMPTYEFKMFPPMAAVLEELGRKKVSNRKAFRIGSYGWSGGAARELDEIMIKYSMGWEFLEPVEFAGSPKQEDLTLIEERVKQLVQEVKLAVESQNK